MEAQLEAVQKKIESEYEKNKDVIEKKMTSDDRRDLEESKVSFEAMADMVEDMIAENKNDIDRANHEYDNQAIA